jgi:hypothetical protein
MDRQHRHWHRRHTNGVCRETRVLTRDRRHTQPIFLAWRQDDSGPRHRVGAALTLEGAKALAEADHTGGR